MAEPSKRLAEECGNKPATEELLFDFNDELAAKDLKTGPKSGDDPKEISPDEMHGGTISSNQNQDLLNLANASEFLETLLGPFDASPETEKAQDALDLDLGSFGLIGSGQTDKEKSDTSTNSLIGSFTSKSITIIKSSSLYLPISYRA